MAEVAAEPEAQRNPIAKDCQPSTAVRVDPGYLGLPEVAGEVPPPLVIVVQAQMAAALILRALQTLAGAALAAR